MLQSIKDTANWCLVIMTSYYACTNLQEIMSCFFNVILQCIAGQDRTLLLGISNDNRRAVSYIRVLFIIRVFLWQTICTGKRIDYASQSH
jgi:hypothetical protein